MKSIGNLLIVFHLISLLNLLKAQENSEKKAVTHHSHHHHRSPKLHVYRHKNTTTLSPTGIWCYTCVSGPLSDLSRAIFMRSLQIPAEAESEFCNDPFNNISTTTELHNASNSRSITESLWGMDDTKAHKRRGLGLLVQPCESSCIKAVLESQNAKIVFRGCLTSVYQQISAQDYFFSMPPVGSCDEQEHYSKHIGTTVTQTCLCSTNYCNGASFYSLYINIFIILFHIIFVS
jgi:hypothetical protein